jgi:hypothetical protein
LLFSDLIIQNGWNPVSRRVSLPTSTNYISLQQAPPGRIRLSTFERDYLGTLALDLLERIILINII